MKKQYIRPALEQMTAMAETIVAVSLQISNEAQNEVSGDVKESNNSEWNDMWN